MALTLHTPTPTPLSITDYTVIPPVVESLPQEHHEKIAKTLTGESNKETSDKMAVNEPEPALPFEQEDDAPRRPSAFRRTRKYWIVVAAFYYFFFVLGLNGGSTGPLLPRFQQFYQVGNPPHLGRH
jgi:hypothetical protein